MYWIPAITTISTRIIPYGQDFPGHIPTGRFSNGKLVPDYLASSLGIKDTIPPFLNPNLSDTDLRTGVNFASAGSGYDDLTSKLSSSIPLSLQIELFRSLLEKIEGTVGEEEAKRIIGGAVVELYDLGSRNMLIAGLPPIGCLPFQTVRLVNPINQGCVEDQNSDAQHYNGKLVKLLPQLQKLLPGRKIVYADC
ncbi:hypothetical protein REPUB_Repub05bG0206200 [Reevesia pubescens]